MSFSLRSSSSCYTANADRTLPSCRNLRTKSVLQDITAEWDRSWAGVNNRVCPHASRQNRVVDNDHSCME